MLAASVLPKAKLQAAFFSFTWLNPYFKRGNYILNAVTTLF